MSPTKIIEGTHSPRNSAFDANAHEISITVKQGDLIFSREKRSLRRQERRTPRRQKSNIFDEACTCKLDEVWLPLQQPASILLKICKGRVGGNPAEFAENPRIPTKTSWKYSRISNRNGLCMYTSGVAY